MFKLFKKLKDFFTIQSIGIESMPLDNGFITGKYTNEDLVRIEYLMRQNKPWKEIAKIMNRPEEGIRKKCRQIREYGLVKVTTGGNINNNNQVTYNLNELDI